LESKNNAHSKAPCIAVLGTGSEVGKSVIATAICRTLLRRGLRVAPFKAQNMSNNSGVTPEGLEMGRAQIVQAEASKLAPHVDMNPILLKPTSEIGSQVVVLGRVLENASAAAYHQKKSRLEKIAAASLDRLRRDYDAVVLEGAGSCAEVNLMSHDIVNFRMAEAADAAVILVADIHRGGVFAQLVGTLECLPQHQRDRVAGFIVNRFRGDIRLFADGVDWIEAKTGKKVFGVLPWYQHLTIEPEDSVVIENPRRMTPDKIESPAVAVIRVPHISNFTDFAPLAGLKGLGVHFLEKHQALSDFQAVILPGSKNTRFDLEWLHSSGWTEEIRQYAARGGHVLGICGGYQMMGHSVHDPGGLEGPAGTTAGLALLPIETTLKAPKTTTLTQFAWDGSVGRGYEIHMGRTDRFDGAPLFRVTQRNGRACEEDDGCALEDGRFMGTYIHGLFDTPEITTRWLRAVGLHHIEAATLSGPAARERDYDLLAAHFETHIDVPGITALLSKHIE
jgi:adenosylcobyric acid synthase